MFKKALLIKSYLHLSLNIKKGGPNPLSGVLEVPKIQSCDNEPEVIGLALYALGQYEKYSTMLYPLPVANRTKEDEYLYSLIVDCYNLYAHVLTLSLPGEDLCAGISRYKRLMEVGAPSQYSVSLLTNI